MEKMEIKKDSNVSLWAVKGSERKSTQKRWDN